MNIVIQQAECAPRFVRNGWAKVFNCIGHKTFFWQKEQECSFDMFQKCKPDILICNSYDCDEALFRCIKNKPDIKVAMFASAWGPLTEQLDKKRFPIVYVSEDEKRLLEKMKKETGQPECCFIHITNKYLEPCMGWWRSIGIEPKDILNGADLFSYLDGQYTEEFACDVGYVGGCWGYKAENINEYLIQLCEHTEYHIKIFGNTPWPVPQCLGQLAEESVKNFFASATVCPNISEPHSYKFPDIVERVFKVPVANGFLISDNVDLSEVFDKDTVPQFSNFNEFKDLIDFYKKNVDKRLGLIRKQKRQVLLKHTYFHRVGELLGSMGFVDEGVKCIDKYFETFKHVLENI